MSAPAQAAADDSSRAAPLRNAGFRRLLAYRICSILSYQVVAVTVGWQVYELTRNPWMLGLIGLAELLPYFCVAPFAGYLVDNLPRRRLGMAAGVGLALGVVVALAGMRVSEPAPVLQRAPIFSSIAEGARFVFGHQILLGALALDMFAVLFGGAISLAPAFIHDILDYGPEGLGILRGAPALGAVAVGVWLARNPIQRNAGRILLVAVACFGLCIIGFGLSRVFWLSAFFLLLSGVCDGVSVVMRSTILQLATPDEMRGRVSSINGLFVGSSNELGAFYAGSMARLLGLVPAVVLGGCVTISIALAAAWRAPRLRRLDLRDLQAGPLEAERGH